MTALGRALQASLSQAPRAKDAALVAVVALAVRLGVVAWASTRIPPTADGAFYHVIARRIADGHGYTWLWPDGAVTYAAHYPVGYPAMLGALYWVAGPKPWVAMLLNALLGAAAAWAVHRVAASVASRAGALFAALAVAFHPALVAYTPALMTEGVTAALWALAAALAVSPHASGRLLWRITGIGALLGLATLVRPQSVLLAPVLGWLACGASSSTRSRLAGAALVSAFAIGACLPWTARNCVRMDRCVFVSANGGWNLLIGSAEAADGGFIPLEQAGVPEQCRGVFGEAAKDACYGRAALAGIVENPLRWLSLAPRKLAVTFDYAGAAGWYLRVANAAAFTERDKLALGVVETVWQRVLLALCLVALLRVHGPRRRARTAIALLAAPFIVLRPAFIAYLALVVAAMSLGRRVTRHPPAALAAGAVAATALAHAVFFGSGRYSLVVMPLLAALAGCALGGGRQRAVFDTDDPDR